MLLPEVRYSDLAIVLATLLGPLLGIQTQKILERRQVRQGRKENIFRTLMATRAARLSPEHVQALNMIDFEFYGRGEKIRNVLNAWNDYRDHLNTSFSPESLPVWVSRSLELLNELLYHMSIAVGRKFEKAHIRKSVYSPVAHSTLEQDQDIIRKGLVQMFTNKFSIPVVMNPAPSTPDQINQANKETQEQGELRALLIKQISGTLPYKVEIVEPNATKSD